MIKEFIIEQDEAETLVDAISLVDQPAIEVDWMVFKKVGTKTTTRALDLDLIEFKPESKRIITGPLMIPDKLIFRYDEDENPYYGFFKKETIEHISRNYLKNQRQYNTTLDHKVDIEGVYLVESWLIEDGTNDKAAALGFDKFPKNTWMGSFKVDNDEVWEKVKSGEVKGFSIEAAVKLEDLNMNLITEDNLFQIIDDVRFSDEDKNKLLYNLCL